MRERNELEDRLGSIARFERELDDAITLVELGESENDAETEKEGVAALKALVSVEMLTVLQLVGFNFKAAIGEPLTQVVETWIRQLAPSQWRDWGRFLVRLPRWAFAVASGEPAARWTEHG